MKDQYTGDVGDFGKYGLLRVLTASAGEGEKLGVVWYLTPDEAGNRDGKHIKYLNLEGRTQRQLAACDGELYRTLAGLVESGQRSVKAVRDSGVLPPGTVYHEDVLTLKNLEKPKGKTVREVQRDTRESWNLAALERTGDCRTVFLDPDNGLETGRVKPHSAQGVKYAFYDELKPYLDRGQSLVVYHHLNRGERERPAGTQEAAGDIRKAGQAGIRHALPPGQPPGIHPDTAGPGAAGIHGAGAGDAGGAVEQTLQHGWLGGRMKNEMDIRIRRHYANILAGVSCRECGLSRRGRRTLSLGDMLEHIERTGHRFRFETVSVHTMADENREEGTGTLSPGLEEFLDINPMHEVVEIEPKRLEPTGYGAVLRRQLERQGFDTSNAGDEELEGRFEMRQVWRCGDGYSHTVELDQLPEDGRCPVCGREMKPAERARQKFPTYPPVL